MVPHLWTDFYMECRRLSECVFPGTPDLMMGSEPLPKKVGNLGLTDVFTDSVQVLLTQFLFTPFCLAQRTPLVLIIFHRHPYIDGIQGRSVRNNVAGLFLLCPDMIL